MRPTVKDSAKNEDKEKEILMRPMVNVWYHTLASWKIPHNANMRFT